MRSPILRSASSSKRGGLTLWLGTDDENIERYLTGQWLISIVLDSKGDNPFCQVDIKEPRLSVKANLEIMLPALDEAARSAAEEEFKEKSSGRVYTYKPGTVRHSGPKTPAPYGGYGGYHGGYEPPGKNNGAARGKGRSDAAMDAKDIVDTSVGGNEMLMLGLDDDEYEAWCEYIAANEDARGVPTEVSKFDTDELLLGMQQPIQVDVDALPDWVVSMADKMGCTVEDLRGAVDVNSCDALIDDVVIAVQTGLKTVDIAVRELEKMGIAKDVAEKEIDQRVNA